MVNWKKMFYFIGLPLLGFYIFLIIIYYAFISTLFLLTLLLGICCLRFSKAKIYSGLTKLALAMLLVFTLFVSNPLYWPTQIARHLDTSLVIQPSHPAVQQLNSTAPGYMWDYLNTTYGITPAYFYQNMTDNERLENMTAYILNAVIEYHYIPEVYGVIDYVSSTAEAIGHGKGDCHSRTIVMVSFFIYMGYDAWACEAPYHWYTLVYLGPDRTDPHYYYRNVFRDGQPWPDPQIIFNHQEVIYTMNVFERLGDVVFGLHFYDKIWELFSIPEALIALWPLLIGIAFLMTLAIRCTTSEKKHYLKNGLFASLILVGGFFLALSFSDVLFPQLLFVQIVFLLMMITVALAAQTIQSNFGGRFFSKSSKSKKN
ncbi:MAG: hypothetical protein ACTSRS_08815 [Candidatus Helarchaeota archaeon]